MNQQIFNDLISEEDIEALEKEEGLLFPCDSTNLKSSRRQLLKSLSSIDVQACPGSGKTTLIAAKLMLLAKKWSSKNQGICVISHTNVAKNEIINRLRNSKTIEAHALEKYPHFIGTIQDFVDRFLALPFVRSRYGFTRFLDDESGIREVINSGEDLNALCKNLYGTFNGEKGKKNKVSYDDIKAFLGSIFWINNSKEIGFRSKFGVIKGGKKTSERYKMLLSLKNKIVDKGFFQYRDMYSYADDLLLGDPTISDFLRKRFPIILVDEMQDTQKFQDELLQKIFTLKSNEVIIQRFGDPDQAIYSRINHEDPNESYNQKLPSEFDFIINKSHRFDNSVIQKIRNLSYNEIPLASDLSEFSILNRKTKLGKANISFDHTIFIYGSSSIEQVITKYAELVYDQFSDDHKLSKEFVVKVVGAVGNNIIDDTKDLKIGSYWNKFVKKKSQNILDGASLIEVIKSCHSSLDVDLSLSYKALNDYILRILSKSGIKDQNGKFFNYTSFKNFLKEKELLEKYRKFLIWSLIDKRESNITQRQWERVEALFIAILGQESIPSELKFVLLDPQIQKVSEKLLHKKGNILRYDDCFDVELSTIHGVKGETHDSTLILETKNHLPDLSTMLPYLTHELPNQTKLNHNLKLKPNFRAKAPNQQFMRQLFVAMSRPKHLLCLAIHEQNITQPQKNLLCNKGWKIVTL